MIKPSDPFELSVEYDLFNSAFGSEVLEIYEIESLIYECDKSIIYKVYRKVDLSVFMLMAFRKQIDTELNVENFTYLFHDRCSDALYIGETDIFQYLIRPFIEGKGRIQ
ncbi:MAG: hypothetical protein IBX70_11415 [Clostridia bacterium]|nr:hypothetical protein [Clostridia bacterium]